MRIPGLTWVLLATLATSVACDGEASSDSSTKSGDGGTGKNPRAPQRERPTANTEAQAQPETAPSSDELVVAVRVHLLKSDKFELLDSSMTEGEVEAMMAHVNEIWTPAQIRFELESVVTEEALDAAAYAEHVAEVRATKKGKKGNKGNGASGPSRADKKAAREATLPKNQRIPKGIDVFVHRSLISAGGVFTCPARAVVFGEYKAGPSGEKTPGAVLAHELGHALGLSHVPCAEGGNLMMTVCRERDPDLVGLRDGQIATARGVAATGEPRTCDRYVDED